MGDRALDWSRRVAALAERHGTPLLVLDRAALVRRFHRVPFAQVGYTLATNPHPDLLHLYADLGCSFAVESEAELRLALAQGVAADQVRFAAAIKRQEAIQFAHTVGVDLLAFADGAELSKIAKAHPGCRVLAQVTDDRLAPLLDRAAALGLRFAGVEVPAEAVGTVSECEFLVVRGMPRCRDLPAGVPVCVEPGRWLLDPAAVRIGRVVGRTRDCCYLDDVALASLASVRALRRGRTSLIHLAGPTGQVVGRAMLPDLAVGDLVWATGAGAAVATGAKVVLV